MYLAIVLFGALNIYSVSEYHGLAQLKWLGLAFILFFAIMAFPVYIYEIFAPIAYGIGLLLLLGLFAFGTEINGAKAWYRFGPLSLQPVELVKISTALMLANVISNFGDFKDNKKFIYGFIVMGIPALLILLQPDVGSLIVFSAFVLAMYREGLTGWIIIIAFYFAFLFIISLLVPIEYIGFAIALILAFLLYRNKKIRQNAASLFALILITGSSIGFSYSTDYIFKNVLKKHHRERIMVLFEGEAKYRDTSGYNLLYAKTAIGSGEWFGKGLNKGTITDGRFVPEQRTDYIFCTVGEEWGFIGTAALLILYALFIARLYYISEIQTKTFNRIVGYSFASIFLIHFFINISMVIGLFPTVGIPLPLFSYGGSSLWGFSIQVFILLKMSLHNRPALD